MSNMPIFTWDEEKGIATCIVTKGNKTFYGIAQCHEEDRDMMSEKTGSEIACIRASIEAFKDYKDNEIKPALAALKQLYYSMNKSNSFNEKSYENKMLQRQIHQKENDLALVNQMLITAKQNLREFIEKKEMLYQMLRSKRAEGQN